MVDVKNLKGLEGKVKSNESGLIDDLKQILYAELVPAEIKAKYPRDTKDYTLQDRIKIRSVETIYSSGVGLLLALFDTVANVPGKYYLPLFGASLYCAVDSFFLSNKHDKNSRDQPLATILVEIPYAMVTDLYKALLEK